jgi:Tol biopolymer transport system component
LLDAQSMPRVLPLLLLLVAAPAHAEWARVGAARVVADGFAPRFSPDGQKLLVTGEQLRGLTLIDASGAHALVDDAGAGVDARFLPDGRVAYRGLRAGVRRELVTDLRGVVRVPVQVEAPAAFARDDRVYVRLPDGTIVSPGTGDRFFAPRLSPDGSRVAFTGLATGIWVFDLRSRALTHLGHGTAPSWSPDGKRLAFERTEDDGHEVVASELYLFEPEGRGLTRLVTDGKLVARRPALGPDGRVAFDDDRGHVYVGTVEVTR